MQNVLGSRSLKDLQASMLVYVASVEAAMAVIKQYELETTTKFSCFKSNKSRRLELEVGKLCKHGNNIHFGLGNR